MILNLTKRQKMMGARRAMIGLISIVISIMIITIAPPGA